METLQALNFCVGQQELTNISAICLCHCLSHFPVAVGTNTMSTHHPSLQKVYNEHSGWAINDICKSCMVT